MATRKLVNTYPRKLALAVSAALFGGTAFAQTAANTVPTNGTYVAGDGRILPVTSDNHLRIEQASQKGIINWGSFSIGSAAHVHFQHDAGRQGLTLNRVVGSSASEIFGRLTANGQIFLVNNAGVLFAPGARVEVGSLFATSLSIHDQDFLAGRYQFYNPGNAGSVVNEGRIVTANGYTALVGPQVRNDGIIVARAGSVQLAAGDRVSLDMIGDGLISVSVDQAALNASVLNSGAIEADGGTVLLAARSANALLDTVINNSGIIRANSLVERNGEIVLDGGSAGVVAVGGTLQAAGVDARTTGGTVKVLGERVALAGSARLDVSGDAGGGRALVGGNFHGDGPERNASFTNIDAGALISADAVTRGDGGRVVVWADDTTRFHGHISARGGAKSGDGGNVEVSGREHLYVTGHADLRAPKGRAGTLLLDPGTVTIIDDPNPLTGGPDTFSDAYINAQLALGNLTIDTDAAAAGQEAINFQDATISISWLTYAFTLNAGGDIVVRGSVSGGAGSTLNFSFGRDGAGGTLDLSGATAVTAANVNATGGGGSDTIIARNSANTWSVTGLNSGTLNAINFSDVENLVGGTANDSFALSAAGKVSTISGGGGSDTLVGNDLANTWAINAANGGTLTDANGSNVFTGIENLTGGVSSDNFVFTGLGSVTGGIDGAVGANTLDWSALGLRTVTLTALGATTGFNGTEATVGGGFQNINALIAVAGPSSLTGIDAPADWAINALNSGSYTSTNTLTFTNFGTLTGGTGTDTFTLSAAGRAAGSINGGGGSDTLVGNGLATTWAINAPNAGVLTDANGSNFFTGIENLTGGTAADAFTLSAAGNISGTIDGGGGTNTLTGNNLANTWSINAANGGTLTDTNGTNTFANIQNLTGGAADDTFAFTPTGSLAGLINGLGQALADSYVAMPGTVTVTLGTSIVNIETVTGSGNDTLVGANIANSWSINAANAGNVTDGDGTGTVTFSGFRNLTGGTSTDSFTLTTGSVTGTINGGADAATNNTLQARNVVNTWNITANNAGSVNNVNAFTNIGNLVGGTNNDSFVLSDGVGVSGTISGGGGTTNRLDYSTYSTAVTVNLQTGAATNTGSFSGLNDFVGSTAADTLIGANGGNAWNITANNAGDINGTVGFNSFESLIGGSSTDNFTLAGGGSVTSINGGAGIDTLTADNVANTWTISGANSGTLNGINWSSIENLAGGNASDNFNGTGGSIAGTISDGGGGTTTLSGTITSGGDQIYGAAVSAGSVTLNAGTGSISATNAANNFTGTLTVNGASVSITDANALTIGGSVTGGLTTTSATLTYVGGMSVGSLNSTASGAVSETGAITVAGPASINAGANNITLTAANDFQGTLSLTGGTTQINDANALTLGMVNVGALTTINTGALDLGSLTASSLSATTNGGDITQSGPAVVSGASDLQAGGGAIVLTNAANDFGGAISGGAASGIQIVDANGMTLGPLAGGSSQVVLTAGGDMSGPGFVSGGTGILSSSGGADSQVSGLGIAFSGNVAVTGSATLWNFTAGSSAGSFSRTAETIGVQVGGVTFLASLVQIQAGNIVGSVSATTAAVIVEEANRTFGTDSVAEAVEYGFAGDIGATPPMDHRIDESGISLPHCVEESREGVACR